MATLNHKEALAFHRNVDRFGRSLDAPEREHLLRRVLPTPHIADMDAPEINRAYKQAPAVQPLTRRASTRARRTMRQKPIRAMIQGQFHILLYSLIQFVFGLYVRVRIAYHAISERLLAILYYHHRTPELIRKDVRHLSKLPNHLSVILTLPPDDASLPGSSGLEKLVSDVAEIAAWCASAGIPFLSIYERTGILKSYIPHTHHAVTRTLHSYFGNTPYSSCPTVSIRAPNVNTYSPPATPPEHADHGSPDGNGTSFPSPASPGPNHLPILLLSAEDGRSTLVDLTKTLTEMSQKSRISASDISASLIDAELSSAVMAEPDLLLVFGPKVVLEGYPPWQVRLTEIFCAKDNREGVGYQVFLRAVCSFAKAQMRFGR